MCVFFNSFVTANVFSQDSHQTGNLVLHDSMFKILKTAEQLECIKVQQVIIEQQRKNCQHRAETRQNRINAAPTGGSAPRTSRGRVVLVLVRVLDEQLLGKGQRRSLMIKRKRKKMCNKCAMPSLYAKLGVGERFATNGSQGKEELAV